MTELLLDVWMFSFSFLSFFLFFPVAGKHDGFKYTGEVTGGKDLKVQYVLPYLTVFSLIEAPGLRQGLGGLLFFLTNALNFRINMTKREQIRNLYIIQDENGGGGASIGEGLLLELGFCVFGQ